MERINYILLFPRRTIKILPALRNNFRHAAAPVRERATSAKVRLGGTTVALLYAKGLASEGCALCLCRFCAPRSDPCSRSRKVVHMSGFCWVVGRSVCRAACGGTKLQHNRILSVKLLLLSKTKLHVSTTSLIRFGPLNAAATAAKRALSDWRSREQPLTLNYIPTTKAIPA